MTYECSNTAGGHCSTVINNCPVQAPAPHVRFSQFNQNSLNQRDRFRLYLVGIKQEKTCFVSVNLPLSNQSGPVLVPANESAAMFGQCCVL